jgi:hypothetical protein
MSPDETATQAQLPFAPVAVLWNPSPWDEEEVRQTEIAARELAVKVQSLQRQANEFQNAYAAMTKEGARAIRNGHQLEAGKSSRSSLIDQPGVIKNILQHLGSWEDSHAPPERSPSGKELTFDPSYGSTNSPSRGRSRDSQMI